MYKKENLNELLDKKNISNVDYSGKNVLIRTCLNVATDKEGNITEYTRIEESVPTIKLIGETANRVVMMAHLGRPTPAREPEFSLEKVRLTLEDRLGDTVMMVTDEKEIEEKLLSGKQDVKYYLLENIRYFEGEETKDDAKRQEFAKKLAQLGDIYVNDAFADYREAASTYDVAKYLPSYLGLAFVKEIKSVGYFGNPDRQFVGILGGAKLSEKLDALSALVKEADKVLIGGAMAYTLMKSQGISIGKSLVEEDKLEVAAKMMEEYGDKIVLPLDHVVVSEFSDKAENSVTEDNIVPEGKIAVDIGPKTIELFVNEIKQAKSLLWNGPMGVFEWEATGKGTQSVGNAIVNNSNAYKFAGGGDSIAAINKFGLKGFDHVSTGGGATLSFVSYDKFPTLDIILEK